MIQTSDLSKEFDGFLAVDTVTLEVGVGEVMALLGPNGAGKTTTVRMLTSVLKPTRGWAKVAGFDVVRQANQVRASVGVLTEQHGLYSRMPADEYLDFFGQIYQQDANSRHNRIDELLSEFGLSEARHRRIGEYSKGMRQKLALARALLHEPPVLLLDEPTSAMDPESARLVRDAIRTLRSRERTVIICTHNLAEAEELADHIAIIRKGKIIAQGSPAALKNQFLGAAEYEMRFSQERNGWIPEPPAGIEIIDSGSNFIRFRAQNPEQQNPAFLSRCLADGHLVYSLHETPRSLEQVYLEAINSAGNNGS